MHNIGVDHWKALCALLFASPKHFLNKSGSGCFLELKMMVSCGPSRGRLYIKMVFLRGCPPYDFSAARLALNALAGVIPARRPSLYPVRHSTSFAGRSQERSKLGTAGLFARASCASGPGVKRSCQERPENCLSWAWSMWRTVVATTANYHVLETCTNLTILERKACIRAINPVFRGILFCKTNSPVPYR